MVKRISPQRSRLTTVALNNLPSPSPLVYGMSQLASRRRPFRGIPSQGFS
ncbi:hypothetical protein CYB_2739 [Synechococcus sp. JA-2-3B'a(2-13)]|nr:hypothetical protein CYB_2739 [Synechococcus sp. JA-2-3B'a(2-13)]